MGTKEIKNRPCEICGNDDRATAVVSSAVEAISYNTCSVCIAMVCECTPYKGHTTFDRDAQKYKDFDNNFVTIDTKSGKSFDTRTEYVKHIVFLDKEKDDSNE